MKDNSITKSTVVSCLIRFNELDADGNIFLPNSINIESLKISGQIKQFEIDQKCVKVFKHLNLR